MSVGHGVWGDPEGGMDRVELGDGKGNSVDGDAAFIDTIAMDCGGEGNLEAEVLAVRRERDDLASSIDVTLDEMPAESRGG